MNQDLNTHHDDNQDERKFEIKFGNPLSQLGARTTKDLGAVSQTLLPRFSQVATQARLE